MELKDRIECSFHYETEANASFLVAELGEETPLVQYQMKMLENNHIAHLLDAGKYQQDETVKIRYNVTGRISLAQILEREKIQRKDFLSLLNALLDCYEELSEYQLPAQGLLLERDKIFIRTGGFEADLLYLPVYHADEGLEDLRRFVRGMIMDSALASTKDDLIQRLLDIFNDQNLTLEDLREALKELQAPAPPPPRPVEPPRVPVFDPPSPPPSAPKAESPEIPKTAKPGKGQKKKGRAEKPPKEKKEGSGKGSILFTALQGVIVLVLALAVKSGFFLTPEGGWNVSYLGGFLLAAAGIDFVVYREIFVNSKEKDGKKAKKKKAGKKAPPVARPPIRPAAPVPPAGPAAPPPDPPVAPPAVPLAAPLYPSYPAPQPVRDAAQATEIDEEHTVVMGGEGFGAGYLEYFENGLAVRIHLDKDVTRVGSRAQGVDHTLLSHKVSKIHAEFVRHDGRYFVRDLNSTNGTYLNGGRERIVSNQEFEIRDGDKVRLADVEMTFKC